MVLFWDDLGENREMDPRWIEDGSKFDLAKPITHFLSLFSPPMDFRIYLEKKIKSIGIQVQ